MALVRRGTRVYYYRSARVDGRVIGRYVTCGEAALTLAALDEVDRTAARRDRDLNRRRAARARREESDLRDAIHADRQRREAEDRDLAAYCDRVGVIARAALEAAGYHQHARGEWRRKMAGRNSMAGASIVTRGGGPPAEPGRGGALQELIERAAGGDGAAAPELRGLLLEADRLGMAGPLIAALGGDLARVVEDRMVEGWAGGNLAAGEALRRRLAQIRGDLEGAEPTPIERLLAERAAICWLAVHRLEAGAAGCPDQATPRAEAVQRQIGRANRRYLSSLRALASVRRMARPVVTIAVSQTVAVAVGLG